MKEVPPKTSELSSTTTEEKIEVVFELGDIEKGTVSFFQYGQRKFIQDPEASVKKGTFGAVTPYIEIGNKANKVAVKKIAVAEKDNFADLLIDAQRDVKIHNALSAIANGPVCAYLFQFPEKKLIFTVTPFITGTTLRERLQTAASLEKFIILLLKSLLALDSLHRDGVIHCDLKDDNIMVAGDGRIAYIDFALSRYINEKAFLLPVGHGHYAPECRATVSTIVPKANPAFDIYSFGYMARSNIKKRIELLKSANSSEHQKQIELLQDFYTKLAPTIEDKPSKRPHMEQLIQYFESVLTVLRIYSLNVLIALQDGLKEIIGTLLFVASIAQKCQNIGLLTRCFDGNRIKILLTPDSNFDEVCFFDAAGIDDENRAQEFKDKDSLILKKLLFQILKNIQDNPTDSQKKIPKTEMGYLQPLISAIDQAQSLDDMINILEKTLQQLEKPISDTADIQIPKAVPPPISEEKESNIVVIHSQNPGLFAVNNKTQDQSGGVVVASVAKPGFSSDGAV